MRDPVLKHFADQVKDGIKLALSMYAPSLGVCVWQPWFKQSLGHTHQKNCAATMVARRPVQTPPNMTPVVDAPTSMLSMILTERRYFFV